MDVGQRRTQVVIGRGRDISFMKPIELGSYHFHEAVSKKLGITVDEARAIVDYLELKAAEDDFARPSIEQALARYWRPRLGR